MELNYKELVRFTETGGGIDCAQLAPENGPISAHVYRMRSGGTPEIITYGTDQNCDRRSEREAIAAVVGKLLDLAEALSPNNASRQAQVQAAIAPAPAPAPIS